jgi:hypothetical protein
MPMYMAVSSRERPRRGTGRVLDRARLIFWNLVGQTSIPGPTGRAKCLDCSGGNDAEVRKCTAVGCALWPLRMGLNPFYGRARS